MNKTLGINSDMLQEAASKIKDIRSGTMAMSKPIKCLHTFVCEHSRETLNNHWMLDAFLK
jgi:hypothetical protein